VTKRLKRRLETVYRGTQYKAIEGARKGLSFAYSLPVAIIWSARPGDIWGRREPQFLPTSTIHIAQLEIKKPFVIEEPFTSLGDVLRRLKYPRGIADDDVRKIYNYLHNRIIGKVPGGDFSYVVLDEDGGEPRDEDEVPLSFRSPQSLISLARDDWDNDPGLDTADLLQVDTFIFADAPAFQRAAVAAGYDAMVYMDVFQGGEHAAPILLKQDVYDLEGVTEEQDIQGEYVPAHMTLRPLDLNIIVEVTSIPTVDVVQ
jgi:hypothetical protein